MSDLLTESKIEVESKQIDEKNEKSERTIPDIEYLKCFCWIGFHMEAQKQGNTTAKIGCFKCREIIADTKRFYSQCEEIGFGMIFCSKCYSRNDPNFEQFLQEDDEYESDTDAKNEKE
jgi:hypothetical protein